MTDHEQWLKEQISQAIDKADRGESVYFTEKEANEKMDDFKKKLAEKK